MTLLTTSLLDSDRIRTAGLSTTGLREALQERLGHQFADVELLDLALRHRSWCSEHGGVESNERLEFLGDSVLGLIITDRLYRRAPSRSEGTLARNRSELVSSAALATVARELDLGQVILLGKGEEATGGRDKSSILADTLEAVIGSVYLDSGMDAAEVVVLGILGPYLDAIITTDHTTDYKSRLQELGAASYGRAPVYSTDEEGPEHDKRFSATVVLDGKPRGVGTGPSKKAAEQAAAKQALESMSVETGADGARFGGLDVNATPEAANQDSGNSNEDEHA